MVESECGILSSFVSDVSLPDAMYKASAAAHQTESGKRKVNDSWQGGYGLSLALLAAREAATISITQGAGGRDFEREAKQDAILQAVEGTRADPMVFNNATAETVGAAVLKQNRIHSNSDGTVEFSNILGMYMSIADQCGVEDSLPICDEFLKLYHCCRWINGKSTTVAGETMDGKRYRKAEIVEAVAEQFRTRYVDDAKLNLMPRNVIVKHEPLPVSKGKIVRMIAKTCTAETLATDPLAHFADKTQSTLFQTTSGFDVTSHLSCILGNCRKFMDLNKYALDEQQKAWAKLVADEVMPGARVSSLIYGPKGEKPTSALKFYDTDISSAEGSRDAVIKFLTMMTSISVGGEWSKAKKGEYSRIKGLAQTMLNQTLSLFQVGQLYRCLTRLLSSGEDCTTFKNVVFTISFDTHMNVAILEELLFLCEEHEVEEPWHLKPAVIIEHLTANFTINLEEAKWEPHHTWAYCKLAGRTRVTFGDDHNLISYGTGITGRTIVDFAFKRRHVRIKPSPNSGYLTTNFLLTGDPVPSETGLVFCQNYLTQKWSKDGRFTISQARSSAGAKGGALPQLAANEDFPTRVASRLSTIGDNKFVFLDNALAAHVHDPDFRTKASSALIDREEYEQHKGVHGVTMTQSIASWSARNPNRQAKPDGTMLKMQKRNIVKILGKMLRHDEVAKRLDLLQSTKLYKALTRHQQDEVMEHYHKPFSHS